MSSKANVYRTFKIFSCHSKKIPEILYNPAEVIIIGSPFLDRESETMTVTWAFTETPWLRNESSISI